MPLVVALKRSCVTPPCIKRGCELAGTYFGNPIGLPMMLNENLGECDAALYDGLGCAAISQFVVYHQPTITIVFNHFELGYNASHGGLFLYLLVYEPLQQVVGGVIFFFQGLIAKFIEAAGH